MAPTLKEGCGEIFLWLKKEKTTEAAWNRRPCGTHQKAVFLLSRAGSIGSHLTFRNENLCVPQVLVPTICLVFVASIWKKDNDVGLEKA